MYLIKAVCVHAHLTKIYMVEIHLIKDPGYIKDYKSIRRKDNSVKKGKRY